MSARMARPSRSSTCSSAGCSRATRSGRSAPRHLAITSRKASSCASRPAARTSTASRDIPVVCFAAGAQEHPYAFFSLKKNPIREPKDLVGKKVGIQATGVILLRALLAKNKIPEKDVQVVTLGADMSPVLTGQVDCVTGWLTNTSAIKVLGPDHVAMRLWDTGVKLYALPYYATATTIKTRADVLAKYLRASSKGWGFAHEPANRGKAVEMLVK